MNPSTSVRSILRAIVRTDTRAANQPDDYGVPITFYRQMFSLDSVQIAHQMFDIIKLANPESSFRYLSSTSSSSSTFWKGLLPHSNTATLPISLPTLLFIGDIIFAILCLISWIIAFMDHNEPFTPQF